MRLCLPFFLLLPILVYCIELDEPIGIDAVDVDSQGLFQGCLKIYASAVYNKTYIEYETELEKALFRGYTPTLRPVKNSSNPTDVYLHWHLVHLSINQKEQTMTVHGHLYMTWRDEFLGWDPAKFNGIKITRSKKWQVWHPKIVISNSASGVYSAFEISSQAHVLIQTINKQIGAKVEMYPTFSIKAGCNFDYTDFPDDQNSCSVMVYSPDACSKVHLRIYGPSIPPTIMFGWGNQSDKNIISDFEIQKVNNSVIYYRSGNFSSFEPITDEDAATSWSMHRLTVSFRRHSALFGVSIVLPVFVGQLLSSHKQKQITFSFLMGAFLIIKIRSAFYTVFATLLILCIFMEDLTASLPLVVMGLPKCISLYGELMVLVCLAVAVHMLFTYLNTITLYGPPLFLAPYLDYLRPVPIGVMNVERGGYLNWKESLPLVRTFTAIVFFCLFMGSYLLEKIVRLGD